MSKKYKDVDPEILKEAKYAGSAETGKVPSDVTIEVKRVKGRPTGGLSKESSAAGGKKARRTTTKYDPTDDDYKKVEEMVLIGLDQHTIAKIMGVSIGTLVKYYKATLETAREQRTARVAGVAYEMAVSGQSPSMTTFWLKTQAGWTPKQHIVHEDKAFDISWAEDEADFADANKRDEDSIH
jgi:transposase